MNKLSVNELIQDDGSIDKIIAKLEKLSGTYESTIATIKGEAEQLAKANDKVTASTSKGREETQKAAKDAEQLAAANRAYTAALSENKQQIEELKVAARTLNELKKNEARLALSAEGSYNRLAAQYNIIKLNLNAMSKAEREGTEEGRKLVKTANEIYQEMKRLQSETGKTALNVGNYSEAVQEATKNVGEMRKELIALRNTSFAGKTDEEIATINKRIGDLVDGMADLKAEQAALGTEMSSLFVSNLKFVAAGVEGLVGTLSLLGVESENLRNLESKMMQLIAVTQALAEIEDVLQKRTLQTTAARIQAAVINAKDTVQKWANTVATTAAARAEDARAIATTRGSLATRAAAAAQWLWNAALAANPIGLVVVAVAALAAGIVYLTSVMGDNTDEIERQSEAYAKMVSNREVDEKLIKQRIALAREQGKADTELTKMELDAAKKRRVELFNEHQAYLKIYYSKKRVTEEETQKNKDYYKEREETTAQIQVLEARLLRQQQDVAEKRKKDAEEAAKQAKAERERLSNEKAAQLKEQQDAAIKAVETERNYQLAKFDAETNFGNQSSEYQRQRAIERFTLEQDLTRALLAEQLRFNRISQKEYETALLEQQAALKEFSARMTQERNAETPGSLPGIDLSKKAEQAAVERVKQIAQKLANKANQAVEKPDDPSDTLFGKIFGISGEQEDAWKTALDSAKSALTDYMATLEKAADQRLQLANSNVQAAENELNRQIEYRAQGMAYNIQAAQMELDKQKEFQKQALAEKQKAQRQQLLLNSVEQASNLATAVSKVYSTLGFPAGLVASGLMIGAFIAAKVKAFQATKQEFAEGGYEFLGGGTHASSNDTDLGFRTKGGKRAFAQRGEFVGIVRHERVPKYKHVLPSIIDSLNAGTFENQFLFQNKTNGIAPVFVQNTTDTKGMERHLERIANNTARKEETTIAGNVLIRKSGNWTTRVKLG